MADAVDVADYDAVAGVVVLIDERLEELVQMRPQHDTDHWHWNSIVRGEPPLSLSSL